MSDDLTGVANGDPTTAQVTQVRFVIAKVLTDVTGTPDLFSAVNLMKADPGINSDLNVPSEAMFKLPAFMLFSGFVLLYGKQGWLYSRQLNGANDPNTVRIGNEVASYSAIYTAYVKTVFDAIQTQIASRLSYLHLVEDTSDCYYAIVDDYNPGGGEDPTSWGYAGTLSFPYCGNKASQRDSQSQAAGAALAQVEALCPDYVVGRFHGTGSSSYPDKVADFNALVAEYVANDDKVQNLARGLGPLPVA